MSSGRRAALSISQTSSLNGINKLTVGGDHVTRTLRAGREDLKELVWVSGPYDIAGGVFHRFLLSRAKYDGDHAFRIHHFPHVFSFARQTDHSRATFLPRSSTPPGSMSGGWRMGELVGQVIAEHPVALRHQIPLQTCPPPVDGHESTSAKHLRRGFRHTTLKQLGVKYERQPRGVEERRTVHHLEVQMWDVAVPRVAESADQVSRPQARALANPGRDRAGLQMAVSHIPPAPNVFDNTVPPGGRGGPGGG